MASDSTRVEYRPLRIGFCVRDGNILDVVNASRLSVLAWGGAYNPIIPVKSSNNELAEELVKKFQIDILVPIIETKEIKAFINKYKWARFPTMRHSNNILSEDVMNSGHKKISVLDVSHLLHKIWNEEFKFAQDGTSNCAIISWDTSDKHKELFTLLFGNYPKPKEKFSFNYEGNFRKNLRAKEIRIEPRKTIPSLVAEAITPIELTKRELKKWGGNLQGAGIYVGDPNNFSDLITFWNLRAAGNYLAFLPKKNSGRFTSYINAHISQIKSSDDFDGKTEISVWFIPKKSNVEEEYSEIKNIVKPFKKTTRIFSFRGSFSEAPSYQTLNEVTCVANMGTKYGKPAITVQLTDKPIVKRERSYRDQYFVVSLKFSASLEFPEYTTNLPYLHDLSEWYSSELVFDAHSVRVTKTTLGTKIGLITDIGSDTIELNPILKFDLIKKIFERATITAEKSGAGLIAERLIALMKGISWAARIFKITGVRKFINETSPLDQKTRPEIEKCIDDSGTFSNFIGEFGLKGTPLTTSQVFETMMEHNLIKAGAEVRCPKCSIKTWITLGEFSEMYNCEFCEQNCKFVDTLKPVSIVKDGEEVKVIDGVCWHYRLSGLFGKKDKQQGAIPVLLTLQHLFNRVDGVFGDQYVYSTGIDLYYEAYGKKQKGETDLVVLNIAQRMGEDNIEMLIGECKNKNNITRVQVDRLVEIKKLIEKTGIKCYLIFTKLKNKFNSTEIDHFKRLTKEGISPILFTENELEWWFGEYRKFEKSRPDFKLPVEHPFTFAELARNSAYIYRLNDSGK